MAAQCLLCSGGVIPTSSLTRSIISSSVPLQVRGTKIAYNLTTTLEVAPRRGRGPQIVVHGRSGRSALYGDAETYVLMEPGEDEQFVTADELQEKLKKWLQEWPGEKLPIDVSQYKSEDEAVQFLVNAVCELDLGDGQGSLQWYQANPLVTATILVAGDNSRGKCGLGSISRKIRAALSDRAVASLRSLISEMPANFYSSSLPRSEDNKV